MANILHTNLNVESTSRRASISQGTYDSPELIWWLAIIYAGRSSLFQGEVLNSLSIDQNGVVFYALLIGKPYTPS